MLTFIYRINEMTWISSPGWRRERADTEALSPGTIIYFHVQPLSITVLPPCPVPALTPHLKAYNGDPPSSGIWLTYREEARRGQQRALVQSRSMGGTPSLCANVGRRGLSFCVSVASRSVRNKSTSLPTFNAFKSRLKAVSVVKLSKETRSYSTESQVTQDYSSP